MNIYYIYVQIFFQFIYIYPLIRGIILNMNILTQIDELFNKDTTAEGESPKLVVVMRLLEFAVICYAIICGIFFFAAANPTVALCFLATVLIFSIMFLCSFKVSINVQIFTSNFAVLVCIIVAFITFGSDTLIQNFLMVLIVLGYFSKYGYYKFKACYTVVVGIIYIFIRLRADYHEPYILLGATETHFLQIMNIILSLLCIAIVCHVYSKDSQHLEGKLLEYNNLLKKQASTDPLTGLTNRRSAVELIDKLIKLPPDRGFCVCMCDIDFFKKVNDSYGHDIGDNVLRGIAGTMLEGLPANCLISRWGGEEFLIIFSNMNGDEAKMILDVMRTRLRRLEFRAGEKKFSVTLTFGLAEYGYNEDADSIVKEADNKLYFGKEHGRDQVVF